MSASQNTINLQNEITAIDTKITALNNASSKIDGVKVKVKTTKDDMSSLHIAGQKYDGFRYDRRASVGCIVDHLSTCILVLTCIRKGNGQHGSTRSFSIQINRWVLHGCLGS